MGGGYLWYIGDFAMASQPLDGIRPHGKSPQPGHTPPYQAPVTLTNQWKEA